VVGGFLLKKFFIGVENLQAEKGRGKKKKVEAKKRKTPV